MQSIEAILQRKLALVENHNEPVFDAQLPVVGVNKKSRKCTSMDLCIVL
ncbi:uncharacterized protein METZ01_LOCUS239723 [marine metagenome]|uniref:Uncharacterized protein n=1 Tax=marine metagenome TaxID=408172 RepID=A0A382HI55_9ZZZZ